MKFKLISSVVATALTFSGGIAFAAGELNIFNWGNYTPPDLIEKFEKQYDAPPLKRKHRLAGGFLQLQRNSG